MNQPTIGKIKDFGPAPRRRNPALDVAPVTVLGGPVRRALEAIVEEANDDRHGDLLNAANANPDAHIEVTLTVREVRAIRDFLRRTPAPGTGKP